MEASWTQSETQKLLSIVGMNQEETWDFIANSLGSNKTSQDCETWFDYLEKITKVLPKKKRVASSQLGPARKRRKASQIERLFKCLEKFCNRSYGTEGALKMHLKLKHASIQYDENYQQQARRAAALSEFDREELEKRESAEINEEVLDAKRDEELRKLASTKKIPDTDRMSHKISQSHRHHQHDYLSDEDEEEEEIEYQSRVEYHKESNRRQQHTPRGRHTNCQPEVLGVESSPPIFRFNSQNHPKNDNPDWGIPRTNNAVADLCSDEIPASSFSLAPRRKIYEDDLDMAGALCDLKKKSSSSEVLPRFNALFNTKPNAAGFSKRVPEGQYYYFQ